MTINPKETETAVFHQYLLSSVSPRPIALVSTIDSNGNVNLSPFSFFNCFSINPPILVFSPSRRVRDNTTKHTLQNILETKEVVIHIVNFSMAEQMLLSSVEFEKGVNEFIKAGFTQTKSTIVLPPRVTEAPISFECRVNDVISFGKKGGAGNLIICEVLLAHFKDDILDEKKMVSPQKLDAIARMGANWYCRVNGNNLFQLPKPSSNMAIGFDKLPSSILKSTVLTGNNLARLASVEKIPNPTKKAYSVIYKQMEELLENSNSSKATFKIEAHKKIKQHIEENNVNQAWNLLTAVEDFNKSLL